jgi:hypothetical protein
MKRDRRAEGERILREAEATLLDTLLEALPEAVKSGESLFLNSEYNSYGLPFNLISERAETLFDASKSCVEMRKALALPLVGSVGQLFLSACEEQASSNEHRRGPRKLALALLENLEHGED